MASVENGANVPTYSGQPTTLTITEAEFDWMQRQHERRLIQNAQQRVARGLHRGSRRTQMELDIFVEIVALAEAGAQARKEYTA